MNDSVSLLTALLGGLLSFFSPCVLPVVPYYLSFVSGVKVARSHDAALASAQTRRVVSTSMAFIVGFSTVFVVLGGAATFIIGTLLQHYKRGLAVAGGVLVVALGLHMLGLFRIPWLLRDARAHVATRPLGFLGAYLVGFAFAFGWTPCIGPILAGILVLAAARDTVYEGMLLLAIYSVGLGIPFLLSGLFVDVYFSAFARLRAHLRKVEIVSGALLVVLGLLLATNRLVVLARLLGNEPAAYLVPLGIGIVICEVWLVVVAFRVSVAWGLTCLLLPPAALVFAARHWQQAGPPLLLGGVMFLFGLALVVAPQIARLG